MKKRKLTEEESIILDCWYQYGYMNGKRRNSGGLSALENAESYLKKHKIINSKGNKRPEIIW